MSIIETKETIQEQEGFPEGHPLHGAKVYKVAGRDAAISQALASLHNLMSSEAVAKAHQKMVDSFQKYDNFVEENNLPNEIVEEQTKIQEQTNENP